MGIEANLASRAGRAVGPGERGIEITEAFPKPLTDDVLCAADVIVTMGCGDACPIFPGKRYEDWEEQRIHQGQQTFLTPDDDILPGVLADLS